MERYVLEVCGSVALVVGSFQGLRTARQVLAPISEEAERLRAAIESAGRFLLPPQIRRLARRALVPAGWLLVGSYGLFLVAFGAMGIR